MRVILIFILLFLIPVVFFAQDFGFGFDDALSGTQTVSIGGEVSAAIIGYFDEMIEGADAIDTRNMFMFSGKLNFSARSSFAEGIINLKLVPSLVPVSIDEAYIRVYHGNFDIAAGLLKLTWGKADQLGPLDIINLPDSSRIFIEMADNNSLNGIKIANPIIHAQYRFGNFSKIEAAFLPSFEIVSMAVSSAVGGSNDMLAMVSAPASDRWIPDGMINLRTMINDGIDLNNDGNKIKYSLIETKTSGLDYAQAGARFTTTIGSVDFGVQYFYGRLLQPAVKIDHLPMAEGKAPTIEILFNEYHQIGIDFATVLAGFNIRAETAANITEDLGGDDGHIYNPSIGWSFGFDRDLFLGINLNCQANGSVRLMDDKVGGSNNDTDYDIEAGSSMTSTRLTTMLSRKFFHDEMELRTAVVWGIEDEDCAIIPAIIWTKDDLRAAFSGGFFLGDSNGQLGQFKNNNFLKISVTYMF